MTRVGIELLGLLKKYSNTQTWMIYMDVYIVVREAGNGNLPLSFNQRCTGRA